MDKKILIAGGVVIGAIVIWVMVPKNDTPTVEAQSPSSPVASELYSQAVRSRKDGDVVEAKAVYQDIVKNYPDYDKIMTVQKELETLNMDMIFSKVQVPGKTAIHEVVSGDTLGKIAKTYGTTVELIQRSNNLKSDVIRVGQKLRVWTGKFNIFVDKSQNILILKDGNEVVKVYSVSTGENNSTPVGTFTVTSRLTDPVWFNRGVVVPPESPQNVLGTRWLGFDIPGYGIHGTVEPDNIGRQVTAGCVRMRNEEVEELYSLIPMGTQVVIVD